MSFDVVVVGSVNVDVVAIGKSLPRPGETCGATELVEGYGGKGANQAIAMAKLGAKVAMVGCVGDDPRGAGAKRNLEAHGVDVGHVSAVTGVGTGVAVIHVGDRGEKAIMAVEGANARLSRSAIEVLKDVVSEDTIVVAQLEVPNDAVLAAAELAHDRGARFVLDPAPARDLPEAIWPLVALVKPNAREATTLTGIVVIDRASAIRAAKVLRQRGARAVAIASPDGNHLVTEGGETTFARHDVVAVDATGAGDAFVGGLVSALVRGASLEEAARFANAAAALKTTRVGAQALPTLAEIHALLGD